MQTCPIYVKDTLYYKSWTQFKTTLNEPLTQQGQSMFETLTDLISPFDIIKIAYEYYTTKCKITALHEDNHLIMISMPFDFTQAGYAKDEILVSFFHQNKMMHTELLHISKFSEIMPMWLPQQNKIINSRTYENL